MNQVVLPSITTETSEILPKDVLFVINSNSGKQHPEKVVAMLQAYNQEIRYEITKDKEAAQAVFEKLVPQFKAVVVVGGDGTVNAALQYILAYPDLVMGVLPNGSGNGFARDLGFDLDLDGLMRAFKRGETLALDLLEINDELSINVSGLGIDSYVAYHFQRSEKRGFMSYLVATSRAVFQFKDFDAKVKTMGQVFTGKYRMIAIANTRQFGNNAIIAPNAKPYGGKYELVLVKPFPFWKYPEIIVKMFSGKLSSSKYIQYLTVKGATQIEWANDKYHLDGEPKSTYNNLNVSLLKGKIKVLKR